MIAFGICLLIIVAAVPRLAVLWGRHHRAVDWRDPRGAGRDGMCRRRSAPLLLTPVTRPAVGEE